MPGTFTPNLNLYKPLHNEVGYDTLVNTNFDILDSTIAAIQASIVAGVTSVFGRTGDVVAGANDYAAVDNLNLGDTFNESISLDTVDGTMTIEAQNSVTLLTAGGGLIRIGDAIGTNQIQFIATQVLAPTPATGDSSTKVATTAFVKAQGYITSGKWSDLQNASANLTLSNAGFTTEFDQTSAVAWTWKNTTLATNLGVNQNSPALNLSGQYFTLGASAVDTWTLQNTIAAGHTSATVTNVAETAGNVVTLSITGGNFVAGDLVTFTGLTQATWLNGQNATLTTATSITLTFTDPTSHGLLGSIATTGQVTQANPISALTITHSGSATPTVLIPGNTVNIASLSWAGSTGLGFNFTGANGTLYFLTPGTNAELQFVGGGSGKGSVGCGVNSGMGLSAFELRSFQPNFFIGLGFAGGTAPQQVLMGGNANLTATSGMQTGVTIGAPAAQPHAALTFAPLYGTANFVGLNLNPTVNQVAISGTVAGVQVVTNVVTMVFSNNPAFGSSATNLQVTVVTNTTLNGTFPIGALTARANVAITNIVETAGNAVTLSCAGSAIGVNDYVYLTGLTTGTWLNGKVVKALAGTSATQIVFTDPTSHGAQATHAETGTAVSNYITYAKTTANITLTTDTGTVVQQGTGAYTGLLVNVIETQLGGTANKLLDLQAGVAGGTSKFSVDNTGAMFLTAAGGAPTSAGTAGTAGQVIYFGGLLYFCSVSGAIGAATWNKLTMAAV